MTLVAKSDVPYIHQSHGSHIPYKEKCPYLRFSLVKNTHQTVLPRRDVPERQMDTSHCAQLRRALGEPRLIVAAAQHACEEMARRATPWCLKIDDDMPGTILKLLRAFAVEQGASRRASRRRAEWNASGECVSNTLLHV